jgi:hypothetical protein
MDWLIIGHNNKMKPYNMRTTTILLLCLYILINFTDLPSLPKVLVTLGELVGLPKELLIELLNFILPV